MHVAVPAARRVGKRLRDGPRSSLRPATRRAAPSATSLADGAISAWSRALLWGSAHAGVLSKARASIFSRTARSEHSLLRSSRYKAQPGQARQPASRRPRHSCHAPLSVPALSRDLGFAKDRSTAAANPRRRPLLLRAHGARPSQTLGHHFGQLPASRRRPRTQRTNVPPSLRARCARRGHPRHRGPRGVYPWRTSS